MQYKKIDQIKKLKAELFDLYDLRDQATTATDYRIAKQKIAVKIEEIENISIFAPY